MYNTNYGSIPSFIVEERTIAPIVTTAEARNHVNLFSDNSFDTQLTGFIDAAQQTVEDYIGEYMGPTVVDQPFYRFNSYLPLTHRRIESVTSVTYKAMDGTTKTVPTTTYIFDDSGLKKSINIRNGQAWPTDIDINNYRYPVNVNYNAEWIGTPTTIKQAILLLVGQMFDNRDNSDYLTNRSINTMGGVESLLRTYRRV